MLSQADYYRRKTQQNQMHSEFCLAAFAEACPNWPETTRATHIVHATYATYAAEIAQKEPAATAAGS
ncbi:MAG: hypothetical protein IPP88_19600 [Betaproteobacteria bacterium]|nr:hypothetical protein [Betaproteobacteria bacterium]